MAGKKILVILTGGIAVRKSLELLQALSSQGAHVTSVITMGGLQFVTEQQVEEASGAACYHQLFGGDDDMLHIDLVRDCDAIVIAPATAHFLAKMAHGMADCLASTLLLANRGTRVFVAPSMNGRMWRHAATRENVSILATRGIYFIGPGHGSLACGDVDEGRMMEVAAIVSVLENYCSSRRVLSGLRAVVTSGATIEPLDEVRYLSNHSSGKQGHAIAAALAEAGADTTLISGRQASATLPEPPNVTIKTITTASSMHRAVMESLPVDIAIMVAAVADWRPSNNVRGKKISSLDDKSAISLVKNKDILHDISHLTERPPLVIGFAAEYGVDIKKAWEKKRRKNCDWLIVNDISGDVMGGDDNEIIMLRQDDEERWQSMPKAQVAMDLVARIGDFFAARA